MTNMEEYWPVIAVAGLAFYGFAKRRFMAAAQPLRLELAAKGEEFLSRPDLPPHMRMHVKSLLESAFGYGLLLPVALLAIPAIALVVTFRLPFVIPFLESARRLSNEERAKVNEIMRLHRRISLGNHPFLWPYIELEMLFVQQIILFAKGLLRGRIGESGDRDAIQSVMEHMGMKVMGRSE